MEKMECPWTGLASIAPRRDLWPVIAALGGPEEADAADTHAWIAAGLSPGEAWSLGRAESWRGPHIRAGGPGWPARLGLVPFGPVALQYEGDLARLDAPGVAVVGARACTPYGRSWARRIAGAVAEAGGVVVSGLATGIDCEAHLAASGATIAVLGQGLGLRMPVWQARARAAILDRGGLVLSEFPPMAPGAAWTFPVRNRIITALSSTIVVVEAGLRSGARNTASQGLTLGRDILAVPGPLEAPASEGCLALLAEGAAVVTGVAVVLETAKLKSPVKRPATREAKVLAALQGGARTPAETMSRTGLSWVEVGASLGTLVVDGRVIRLPGQRYQPA